MSWTNVTQAVLRSYKTDEERAAALRKINEGLLPFDKPRDQPTTYHLQHPLRLRDTRPCTFEKTSPVATGPVEVDVNGDGIDDFKFAFEQMLVIDRGIKHMRHEGLIKHGKPYPQDKCVDATLNHTNVYVSFDSVSAFAGREVVKDNWPRYLTHPEFKNDSVAQVAVAVGSFQARDFVVRGGQVLAVEAEIIAVVAGAEVEFFAFVEEG